MSPSPLSRRIVAVFVAVVILLTSCVVAVGVTQIEKAGAETASPTFSAVASADTTPANSGKTPGQAITNLVDGSTITVALSTTNTVTAVSARLCKGQVSGVNVTYNNSSDFNPTSGGKCVLRPFGLMTTDIVELETAPPFKSASIAFKVGVGSDTFTRQNSQSTTINCGPAFTDACKLVLKVSTTGGTEFVSFPLNYASAPSVVTFNANGGSGTMSDQTFTVAGVALTANAFTRTGYTFAGWATTASGPVAYSNSATYSAAGNVTLFAVWTAVNYTVTFNANSGSGTMSDQTFTVAGVALTA
ncbi:MAG: InlB B-repeat-containing protein, partial [Actinomycetes bacterium]